MAHAPLARCGDGRRRLARAAAPGLAGVALLALLAGCSSAKDARACPKIEVVDDLSRMVQFADGPGRDLSDIAYVARIQDVKSGCAYDKAGVTVDMTVSVIGERSHAGVKLAGGDVTYFVAITDASEKIVAKRLFTSRLAFSGDQPGRFDDQLDQRIPLSGGQTAADHTIIVGFQLTPEQINFNEKRKTPE